MKELIKNKNEGKKIFEENKHEAIYYAFYYNRESWIRHIIRIGMIDE